MTMNKNDLIRLSVTDLNNLGCGVGHLAGGDADGMTVFVQGAITGDEIEARVIKVTRGYLVARLERIVIPSEYRSSSDCNASLGCGGCVYRHVIYSHELDRKRAYVENAFKKAGLADVTVEAVRSTGETVGYRNKAQYPVGVDREGKTVAGFYAVGSHRIVPSDRCALQPTVFERIARFVCDFCDRNRIPIYDERTGKGLLRHLYLRMGKATGEVMVCLVVKGDSLPHEEDFAREIIETFPSVVGVLLNTNRADTNVVLGERYRVLAGKDSIEDELCGLRFRISPQAFYQVNHDACELLYGIAKERADLSGGELLLDLYCGIGTIGLSMADRAGEVMGVEIVPEAVECAKENAARNGITNATFVCGDASDPNGLLRIAADLRGDLSGAVVILDPPRKGTTRKLIASISAHGVKKVVYVSCNPDTLARDCAWFREEGYEIGSVTPVDLFPRTGHVESVVSISRPGSRRQNDCREL